MKQGVFRLMTGIMLGYCLAQGLVYAQSHYLWTFFYRG